MLSLSELRLYHYALVVALCGRGSMSSDAVRSAMELGIPAHKAWQWWQDIDAADAWIL